jgi:RNA-binding protein PNO1
MDVEIKTEDTESTTEDFTPYVSKNTKKALKRKLDDVEKEDSDMVAEAEVSEEQMDTMLKRPAFPPLKKEKLKDGTEIRKVTVPRHRYGPLKENWMKIYEPIVEHLKLQVRFNLKMRMVEIRTCKETKNIQNLQKAADFVRAFTLGFDIEDALALVRLDDLFVDSFEVTDVKMMLKGDHLSRAIGRVAGKGGRTKFTIENVTKTRIVVADQKIHILGSYQNIAIARRAICNLIMGSPINKVYGTLRSVSARTVERF